MGLNENSQFLQGIVKKISTFNEIPKFGRKIKTPILPKKLENYHCFTAPKFERN